MGRVVAWDLHFQLLRFCPSFPSDGISVFKRLRKSFGSPHRACAMPLKAIRKGSCGSTTLGSVMPLLGRSKEFCRLSVLLTSFFMFTNCTECCTHPPVVAFHHVRCY